MIKYIKKQFEKIRYHMWKSACIHEGKKFGPLMAFPFLMFVELELDGIFAKEGLEGARKAVCEWPKKFEKKLMDAFDDMNPHLDSKE